MHRYTKRIGIALLSALIASVFATMSGAILHGSFKAIIGWALIMWWPWFTFFLIGVSYAFLSEGSQKTLHRLRSIWTLLATAAGTLLGSIIPYPPGHDAAFWSVAISGFALSIALYFQFDRSKSTKD